MALKVPDIQEFPLRQQVQTPEPVYVSPEKATMGQAAETQAFDVMQAGGFKIGAEILDNMRRTEIGNANTWAVTNQVKFAEQGTALRDEYLLKLNGSNGKEVLNEYMEKLKQAEEGYVLQAQNNRLAMKLLPPKLEHTRDTFQRSFAEHARKADYQGAVLANAANVSYLTALIVKNVDINNIDAYIAEADNYVDLMNMSALEKDVLKKDNREKMLNGVWTQLLANPTTAPVFIQQMQDTKKRDSFMEGMKLAEKDNFIKALETANNRKIVDLAATVVQNKYGLTSANGDFEGAYLHLMDPNNRKELGINFDQANHIITSLKNNHLILLQDEKKNQQISNKAISDEYLKLYSQGQGKQAESLLTEAIKNGSIEGTEGYVVRDKVRSDIRQAAAEGRAITSFGWQTERHSDEVAMTKAITKIYQNSKPGTAEKAVAKFKEGMVTYGITGPENINSYSTQILEMPDFNKKNKGLSSVLGVNPQEKKTPVQVPTAERIQKRNPATGEIVEWDGKQWLKIK